MTTDWQGQATTDSSGWTYNADFTTARDQIRVMIGDTLSTDPLLSDEEIAQAYALEGTIIDASILAAQWAAAKMAKDPDTNFDGISTKRSQRHSMMLETIARLKERKTAGSLTFSAPSSSSISQVLDVTNYPVRFNPSDTGAADWEVVE